MFTSFQAIGYEHVWNVDKVRSELRTKFAKQGLCLDDINAAFIKCKAFSLFIGQIVRGHCDVKNDHREKQQHTMKMCTMIEISKFSTDIQQQFST